MMESRNILIVLAHPDPASFNHALAEGAAEALVTAGHKVTLVDLCAEGFRADISPADTTVRADEARFHVQGEQANAARHGVTAPDIARHQALLAEADNLILQFPMWWGGPPAILKGWVDRVLSYGFAYVDGRRFETGLLRGRRALISTTTGGTPARFSEDGVYGPIEPLLRPLSRLALEYTGFEMDPPVVSYGVPRTDDADRKARIKTLSEAALSMAHRPVAPSNAWRNALDTLPDNAWSRKT